MRVWLGVACLFFLGGLQAKEWLIDVRSPEEFASYHVPGAINIEYQQVVSGLQALGVSKQEPVHLYCRSGRRAELARESLQQAGYQRVNNLGSVAAAKAHQESSKAQDSTQQIEAKE